MSANRAPRTLFAFLSLAVGLCIEAQGALKSIRSEVTKAAKDAPFEIRGPNHPLTQDLPFVVTVVMDTPQELVAKLEERGPDGVAPYGFTELDVWNDAIHFHESQRHLGSDAAACRLAVTERPPAAGDPSGSPTGVRQIGPVRFGLFASPLRTSVAWQATMVLTRSGQYSIEAIPAISAKQMSLPLTVGAESHWPGSLMRALHLSMLVIAAAMFLVAPPRILPLFLLVVVTAPMAWYAVPQVLESSYRNIAAAIPLAAAVISWRSRSPLLKLLLPERHSGALRDDTPADTAQTKSTEAAREHASAPSKAAREPAEPTKAAEPKMQPETAVSPPSGDAEGGEPQAGTGSAAEVPPWRKKLTQSWQVVRDSAHAFGVKLRGPVREADVLQRQEEIEPPAPPPPEPEPAPAVTTTIGMQQRNLPEPGTLKHYKQVADGIVAAVEHRAQWQLVVGGASGLAAMVFLLTVSVTFGDAAITAPRAGESMLPLIVRLLPYLLCFASFLLAAGFLLRQYRASLDDFRHFVRNQRLRESQVVAFEAARFIKGDDDVARKAIDILAWGEASGGGDREPPQRDGGTGGPAHTAGE